MLKPSLSRTSLVSAALACALVAPTPLIPQTPGSYLEFGTVVAIGKRNIDVQMPDPRLRRTVQRSFLFSRDSRADLVHVGDTVEVIYSAASPAEGGGWKLDRLIALRDGIPSAGPSLSLPPVRTSPVRSAPTVAEAEPAPAAASVPAPEVPRATVATASAPKPAVPAPVVPARTKSSLGRSGSRVTPTARNLPRSTQPAASQPSTAASSTVALGTSAQPVVPRVSRVPLGATPATGYSATPKARNVAGQSAAEQCSHDIGWNSRPISMAVLDFRYPTEREESHDISSTGGGSGTALADLVFENLGKFSQLDVSRGDRQKIFRMDFAGAARVGRQLGVDLVLLGTFAPVDPPPGQPVDPNFPQATQAYTLRAGIVEVCTGALLYKLTSIDCPAPPVPTDGKPVSAPSCPGSEVTAKQASAPDDNPEAFHDPIANLLAPLTHNGTPRGVAGTAGMVATASGEKITAHLAAGAAVKPGDQLAIHSFRLTKNPASSTVEALKDEEIGRMTVKSVSGNSAVGTYQGDVPAMPGDTANIVTD